MQFLDRAHQSGTGKKSWSGIGFSSLPAAAASS
jgi:hypothetical protein